MSFLATAIAASSGDLRMRVTACLYKLAQDVMNESPGAADHAQRQVLAQDILRDPGSVAGQFTWACAANPSIAATVDMNTREVFASDGDIEFVCSSVWSMMAARHISANPNPSGL